jgi:EpsD family peptidyl-prolyl cis-trans isomerase
MLATLVACGKSTVQDETQLAARVNQGEISVHQVQAVLRKQPRLPDPRAEAAPLQVLEVLIDQELAAQAATKQGLDSEPSTIQALQLARREVLARAYFDRVAEKASMPSSDEVDRYYDAHPALFAQRRIYTLHEFAVEADASQVSRLKEVSQQTKSVDALTNVLRELGLRYTSRQLVQPAEDVPLGLLDTLAKSGVGQSVAIPQSGGARVFCILQVLPAPVDRRTAAESIAKYLVAEQKRRYVADAMAALRKDAAIRHVGAFSKPSSTEATARPGTPASAPR